MKALCMINVKPGTVDNVVEILRKKRKISKNTAAVIVELSSVMISAPVGFTDGTILGIILAIIMQPITLIAEII